MEPADTDADTATTTETSVERALAASSLGPLAQRQEGVAQMIVEDGPGWQLRKLTHLRNFEEAKLYARAHYLVNLIEAVAQMDDEKSPGFQFPPMDNLLRADYGLRDSSKQHTRKILESITKIFERGGEGGGRSGGIFRRRG